MLRYYSRRSQDSPLIRLLPLPLQRNNKRHGIKPSKSSSFGLFFPLSSPGNCHLMWMSTLRLKSTSTASTMAAFSIQKQVRVASVFLLVISVKLLPGVNDSSAFSPFKMPCIASSYAQHASFLIAMHRIYLCHIHPSSALHQFLF